MSIWTAIRSPRTFLLIPVLCSFPCATMASSVTKTYDLDDFASISVFAPCEAVVTQADEFMVEVIVDEEDVDALDVYKSGTTLIIDLKPGDYRLETLQARVTLPVLDTLEIVGTANATLSAFDQDELKVQIVGTGRVTGRSMRIDDVNLNVIGTGGVDFREVEPLQTARVHLDGVIEVTLNMDVGASLAGSLVGLAKLRYWGTSVNVNVDQIGLSSIEKLGGTIPTSPPDGFRINPGLNDAWYDPATSGQGFYIAVLPDLNSVSLAWFTYDTERPAADVNANLGEPGHRWLTAFGPIAGNQAVMNIDIARGGIFDASTDIQHTFPVGSDGTITLTFDGCRSGTVDYNLPSIHRQGSIPIKRLANDNIALCEMLGGD